MVVEGEGEAIVVFPVSKGLFYFGTIRERRLVPLVVLLGYSFLFRPNGSYPPIHKARQLSMDYGVSGYSAVKDMVFPIADIDQRISYQTVIS